MAFEGSTNGAILASGGFHSRRKHDFYPTPPECTHALMRYFGDALLARVQTVLEPACGDGAMSKVLEEYGLRVMSSDIQSESYGHGNVDYLATEFRDFDAIITNPPFSLSEQFIRKALRESPVVAMIFKSQFWHAQKRLQLFNEHRPSHVLAMSWRPDFASGERGGAPTMEAIWTVWGMSDDNITRYDILPRP